MGKQTSKGGSSRAAGGSAGTSASRLFPTGSGFSRAAAGGGWASPSASGASSGSVRLTLGSGGTAGGVGAAGRRSDSRQGHPHIDGDGCRDGTWSRRASRGLFRLSKKKGVRL